MSHCILHVQRQMVSLRGHMMMMLYMYTMVAVVVVAVVAGTRNRLGKKSEPGSRVLRGFGQVELSRYTWNLRKLRVHL
jgi:hypothetical protein